MEKEPSIFRENTIKKYGEDELFNGDTVEKEGELFKGVIEDTGYTLREYFSHSSDKGPGRGWDFRSSVLKKYGVKNPSELPDDPYFETIFEPIENK